MAFLNDLRIQLHVLIYGPIEAVVPVNRRRPPNFGSIFLSHHQINEVLLKKGPIQ